MENFLKEYCRRIFPQLEPFLYPIIHILIIFILAAIAWVVLNILTKKVEKQYHDYSFLKKNDQIFILIRKAVHYAILIIAGLGFLKIFKAPIVEKIFYAFMIMLLTSIACSIANNLLPYLEGNLATTTKTRVDDVILSLAKKFAGIIMFTTGGILALDVLGLNIMPFVAGAGVAGIAIGFAAKDTLSNLIAGILLLVDRPFETGDRIEVWSTPKNSATWGDVLDIGLRATKIRTTDNIVIIIPNNEIMKRDIINYTTITKEIRVRIPVGIAYDADINKAKEIIAKVALELDWVMREPPPKVVVKSFGDSAVNLEARIWISDPIRRMDTTSHITDRVKDAFQVEKIEIPFPKRDIYIKKSES